jgi:hypothetical protein
MVAGSRGCFKEVVASRVDAATAGEVAEVLASVVPPLQL